MVLGGMFWMHCDERHRRQRRHRWGHWDALMDIKGSVTSGFEKAEKTFADSREELGLGGGAFAAFVDGKKVIDLWCGEARPGVEWARDTLAIMGCPEG